MCAPLAAGVILLFALLQWKSMHVGSGVQNFTTILKAVLFLAVARSVLCIARRRQQRWLLALRRLRAGRCLWLLFWRCRR